jgi:DNA/RNA endonuclease G (NUC1)/uncharacterized protein YjdB
MRLRIVSAAIAAVTAASVSCSEPDFTGPKNPAASLESRFDFSASTITLPEVRISELHYDNAGTDAGEGIEISGPAGMSLTGWKLVLYNGGDGTPYNTANLSGTIGSQCTTRGVSVKTYGVNGIQNGDPDGVALVNPSNAVVEFISYGGVFTGASGVAAGRVSREIGVKEGSSTQVGQSLSIDAAGTWLPPSANTFGSCNDVDAPLAVNTVASVTVTPSSVIGFPGTTPTFTGTARNSEDAIIPGALLVWTSSATSVATVDVNGKASALSTGSTQITATASNGIAASSTLQIIAAPALPATRFSEIHYDNASSDINEAIEVEGPAGTSLTGWKIILYTGSDGTMYSIEGLTGNIPLMCDGRGVAYVTYPPNGIQNGSPDGFALVDENDNVIEFLSYEGSFTAVEGPAAGLTSRDIGVAESGSVTAQSLSRNAAGVWLASGPATIGACNSGVGPPPPPPSNAIIISGRDAFGDVPLPVGFEDQLFATLVSPLGVPIETTFTWNSETPALASIDSRGVMHALGAGIAIVRATAGDGTTRTFALPTRVATASTTAVYAGNTEFGIPLDASPADDYLVTRTEYTASFNVTRGTPNWVSYDLEQTHFGAQDRCDCFTYDPLLPNAGHYTTADYTGAGEAAGYGIDRGHMARSFDRTSGSLDNARTFYFSNIVPQAADLNQGPWAVMENFLGDLARFQNKEVYIIAGVAGNKGTLKNEGKIVIPEYTWKVALVLPRDEGLSSVDSYDDVVVYAAIMPNNPGVRNVDWHTYLTTVDAVEALSGYDLLAALPNSVESAVESGIADAKTLIDQLVTAGDLSAGNAKSLNSKLDAAIASLDRGNTATAVNQLNALVKAINSLIDDGVLESGDAAPLLAQIAFILGTLT